MRARLLRCRPFSTRLLALLLLIFAFLASCYYYNSYLSVYRKSDASASNMLRVEEKSVSSVLPHTDLLQDIQELHSETCSFIKESTADIDTLKVYPSFDFQPSWLRTKEFWDKTFEERYENTYNDTHRPKLKVIVVPHSHNDPGWLKTFEQYFDWKTKNIINNIVHKLNQYPNMTFIWTEISFLNAWWESSHPVKQKALKKLIKEGRLEITTGGWVMPDEACTHIYALVDQFIEGHQWVKTKLGINPRTGWSIDPFGHGPTVPYLLDKSGLEGTIIQRIHYAWKQWLAQQQIEEFHWIPGWSSEKPSIVVHNQPFDIYSIKSTCGPHPSVCLSYDFRLVPGEYNEYAAKHEDITEQNLHSKAKTLIEEYKRIGSLTSHNVVLVPLGDDFRYELEVEFDAQYTNYMKMFNYINSNKELFNADVQFGTPLDYFNAVQERQKMMPTLRGDFFVYSEIFSEGKPAYWSGYYTTRPYIKILARQLEHQLRTSEILFTLVWNQLKQLNDKKLVSSEKRLEKSYEELIKARRNLGLFQHHDAITGTSRASIIYDYGTKLMTSLYHCLRLQETALTPIMILDVNLHTESILQSEVEWDSYGKHPKKIVVTIKDNKRVVLFNSLAEPRTEVVTIRSQTPDLRIFDTLRNEYALCQVSPNVVVNEDGRYEISNVTFDVSFVASVPALTAVTYNLHEYTNSSNRGIVYCNNCTQKSENGRDLFLVKKMMLGDIQLENSKLKLLINRNSGFLKQIFRKDIERKNSVEIQFGAYQSAQRHSGAYLFMPDYDSPEKQVLLSYTSDSFEDNIIIVSGPISTELTTIYWPFLTHTVKIYNVDDAALSSGVYIENVVDFESPPKNRETEMYMRIQTDIENGEVPEFYTDQNGFQYQKRVKIDKLGIEANYYPITTMAWLQDENTRLTLITNHAQGASSYEPGRLEIMLERRTLYDDYRGIGEGVVDNKPTVFQNWLLIESTSGTVHKFGEEVQRGNKRTNERHFNTKQRDSFYELPSQAAEYLSRSLNYPLNVYVVDTSEVGEIDVKSNIRFVENFPTGVHLLNLRTITDDILEQFPSPSCYMVVHRPGYDCGIGDVSKRSTDFSHTNFSVKISNITSESLTGLRTHRQLSSLKEIRLENMEIKTYRIRF